MLSNTNSPNIPQLRTPSIGAAPAEGIDFDEALPAAALDCDGNGGAYDQGSWWDAPGNNENNDGYGWQGGDQKNQEGREVIMMDDDDTGFDSRLFPGDWTDDLGHWISVWPSQPRPVGGKNDRRRGRGRRNGREQENQPERVSMCFEALLAKQGLPEKRFNIAKDRRGRRWFCGNGKLIPEESSAETLVWLALDGRKSSWTRTPPEGPVYFDPPPQYQQAWNGIDMWNGNEGQQQYVYFVMQDENGNEVLYCQQQTIGEGGDQEQRQDQQEQGGEEGDGGDAGAAGAVKDPAKEVKVCSSAEAAAAANERSCGCGSLMWNPSTPEFVPSTASEAVSDAGESVVAAASAPAAMAGTLSRPASSALSTPGSAKAVAAPPPRRHTAGTPSPLLRPKAGSGNSPFLLPSAEVSSSSSTPILQRRGWGRTPTPSPKLGPLAAPHLGPVYGSMMAQQQQQQGAAAAAAAAAVVAQRRPSGTASQPVSPPRPPVDIELSGPSSQMTVEGSYLKWRLAEKWGQLQNYFKESHVTSPIFSVRKAASMQLAFYPNGSRTAEAGLCTVALTRGPDSAGIKFEFLVNGRSIGPKVCLGRRYMADCPKPLDDGGNAEEEVVITMHVLEILGD